ncbi:2-hydroxyacid dehydrogenase [Leucothrix arctica]|uniref:Hydroxyacid dehydrogenase n=1 Tax=Leucothrix arctica TaxID=1481894 RepID=A0A317C798_9GAMM|nr:2-hydroxyacid dehydrogenase [Leucothrix arctica]PWQ94101.1 hydroxyacid dehydrogenase [Leucothrix arctica]
MSKPHILHVVPYPKEEETSLEARFTLHRLYEVDNKAAFYKEYGATIRGISTRASAGVTRETIESLPKLEIISVYGVGYDKVDLEAAKARNIIVTNTPDVLTGDVADLAVGMLLMLSRRMSQAEQWVHSGNWVNTVSFPLSRRVHGKRIGILGLGRIGDAIAERLSGFEMQIAYTSRQPKETAAPDWEFVSEVVALAEQSDVLIVALASTPETQHLVNAEVIEALGPNGLLVNISRSSNVDETALLNALESGALAGAALDVFEGEPNINPRFLALENVLVQPHIGSATTETRQAMMSLVLANLEQYFEQGEALTPVY